ncbi:MAG: antibiotic biosynthesis monooxygenase [Bacteroidia bacterium]|jgi:quinol monooxygenase YgiN|nr:antibiotic biosynthesis monooxygenase [Bacteroidia bacterium]
MIKRIVKMEFRADKVEEFKLIFKTSCSKIKARKGCHHVELLQDINNPCLFFTFSIWDEEADLNAYRDSDLFAGVWAATKALFNAKPEAWTLQEWKD